MTQDYRILKVTAGAATNGQIKMFDISGNAATIVAPSLSSGVTITLPATTATLAGKGLNETISGNWTFSGTVNLNGVVSFGAGAGLTGPGVVPLGAVLATFPNLSGAYACATTTAADANGFVKCNGGVISDGTSPMNGVTIPNINNTIFITGSTTAGSTGGAATVTLSSANLAAHTHGAGTFATSVGVTGGTASLTGTTTFASDGHTHTMGSHTHTMTHYHAWAGFAGGATWGSLNTITSPSTSAGTGSLTSNIMTSAGAAGGAGQVVAQINSPSFAYTTGSIGDPGGGGASAATGGPSTNTTAANTGSASVGISSTAASLTGSNAVTGTSGSTGSATAFSILPTYISAVYVMRIK